MRGALAALALLALLAAAPFVFASAAVLDGLIAAMPIALAGAGWNLLGGYGGRISLGHAAFFGTGAIVTAMVQARYGLNAFAAFALAIAAGALLGTLVMALAARAGRSGAVFALVTLVVAQLLHLVAVAGVAPVAIAPDPRVIAFQFTDKLWFYFVALGLVAMALLITALVAHSRFGAELVAAREDEDAARALGVDATAVRLAAAALSGAIAAAAGGLYAQIHLLADPAVVFGPRISIEAMLAPLLGGLGTVPGPLLGALATAGLGEAVRQIPGAPPGLELAVYGLLLVAVAAFAPRGIAGLLARRKSPPPEALAERRREARDG